MLLEAVGAGGGRFVVLFDLAQGFGVGGVDGGDDGEVVLEFVEVIGGGGDGVVERVGQGGVEGAEGKLVDVVGEVERCCKTVSYVSAYPLLLAKLTAVIKMLAEFHIPLSLIHISEPTRPY